MKVLTETYKVRRLTRAGIRPYGMIIDGRCAKRCPDGNSFGIMMREKSKGWRIAWLVLRQRIITRLERHDSPETFEPVKGRAVIALAPYARPGRFKIFLLDRPVVIKEGVWHGVAALTPECHIKIVENSPVHTFYSVTKHPGLYPGVKRGKRRQ